MKTHFAALAFAAASVAFGAPATYSIDSSHSAAQFSVRHLMISNVKGEFSKVTGTVVYDPANLGSSRIDATIDATTVNTREEKRDAHLRAPDFLDTAKYPTMTFKSTKFTKANGKVNVTGDLTLHGVTKQVTLAVDGPTAEVKDPWGNLRIGATATTKINRKDFGLTWNQALETGGVVVGDEVSITLDIEAVRKPGSEVSAVTKK